jgi:hypothetical protein
VGIFLCLAPAYGKNAFISADTRNGSYPARSPARLYRPTLDAATTAALAPAMSSPAYTLVVPGTVFGKRPRGDEEIYEDEGLGVNDGHQQRQCKKGKGN